MARLGQGRLGLLYGEGRRRTRIKTGAHRAQGSVGSAGVVGYHGALGGIPEAVAGRPAAVDWPKRRKARPSTAARQSKRARIDSSSVTAIGGSLYPGTFIPSCWWGWVRILPTRFAMPRRIACGPACIKESWNTRKPLAQRCTRANFPAYCVAVAALCEVAGVRVDRGGENYNRVLEPVLFTFKT